VVQSRAVTEKATQRGFGLKKPPIYTLKKKNKKTKTNKGNKQALGRKGEAGTWFHSNHFSPPWEEVQLQPLFYPGGNRLRTGGLDLATVYIVVRLWTSQGPGTFQG
jgi:hypothetical protein